MKYLVDVEIKNPDATVVLVKDTFEVEALTSEEARSEGYREMGEKYPDLAFGRSNAWNVLVHPPHSAERW